MVNKYAANPTFHLDISIDSYTSPVNAGADEIRDTAVMVLFQGKEFSLSKPERENSSINMVCSHPQLGSPLCGSRAG